jgi:cobalamin biosynthesis protein CobD/CbiB
LGVQLDKPGHYVLGDAAEDVSVTTIDAAWRIVRDACWTAVALAVLVLGVRHVYFG